MLEVSVSSAARLRSFLSSPRALHSLAAPSPSEHNPGALGQVGSPAVTAQIKHLPSSSEPGTHSSPFQTAHGNAWARRTAAQGSSVDNSKRETSTEHSYLPVLAAQWAGWIPRCCASKGGCWAPLLLFRGTGGEQRPAGASNTELAFWFRAELKIRRKQQIILNTWTHLSIHLMHILRTPTAATINFKTKL